jgi:hypothetical protein
MANQYPDYLIELIDDLSDKTKYYCQIFQKNPIEVEAEIIKLFKEEYNTEVETMKYLDAQDVKGEYEEH